MWQSVLSAQISDIHLSTQVSMMHERTPGWRIGLHVPLFVPAGTSEYRLPAAALRLAP